MEDSCMQMWNMTLLEHLALKNKYKTVDDYGILLHIQMVYPKCCKTETKIIQHYFYIFCELSKIIILMDSFQLIMFMVLFQNLPGLLHWDSFP